MSATNIEWADRTWNPTTGCQQVSPGCDRCYAKRLVDTRMSKNPRSVRYGSVFEEVMLHEGRLNVPRSWHAPALIFVDSMSDLFHRDIPDEFLDRVFDAMIESHWHIYQVLTKRPERMRRFMLRYYERGMRNGISARQMALDLRHVWLGVSIESNDYAWRAGMLRETPAAVRFLSIEPMLAEVDKVDLAGIDWVIVGGESGRGARSMDPQWARDLRDRCDVLGIPFFFKQWGGETKKYGHEDAILDGVRHVAWPVSP